jgi:hypothetical protein
VVIYAYNHHVRLLSPEPMVVKQPQFTRVEEPTLLCNQVPVTGQKRASRRSERERRSVTLHFLQADFGPGRRTGRLASTFQRRNNGPKLR